MKRLYEEQLKEHFKKYRQMVFLVGPRQVGKTTVSMNTGLQALEYFYFNWDNRAHQLLILEGPQAIAKEIDLQIFRETPPLVIFDEIHKFKEWKIFLKGFFDTYPNKVKILVTGSAKLNAFKSSGESLMGRYFLYRMHPLSIAELVHPTLNNEEIRPPKLIDDDRYEQLLTFGGFPEPFLQSETNFYQRWKTLREQQLFYEDIQTLTRIQEIQQMEILSELLRLQAGQLTNLSSFAKKIQVSVPTIQRWLSTLVGLFYCFKVKPWSKNISRSLIKEPKYYLWDWSLIEDEGAKKENLVASHLLKAVQFWTDQGIGEYDLYFLRDKNKREVKFVVTKNKKPWFLVEVKNSSNHSISPSLYYFHKQTQSKHAFQVAFDLPYVDRNCFEETEPVVIPAKTFLSQLV